ncbi:caspase family protein [Larkinella terrae]|nr:caspase family protein [Larkinella terrae]
MRLFILILGVLYLRSSVVAGQPQPPAKRALIIAIGNYPRSSGWLTINAQNDVMLVQTALRKQGFQDIKLLQDQDADRVGIVNALRDLILRSQKGDKIVIHFSSHGQQISDNNNDEADSFDEAIVCYGAPQQAEGRFATYNGDQHLRDEDLGRMMDELRKKLGSDGDVLLLVDACHSGTITRGSTAKIRGHARPLHLTGSRPNRHPNPSHAFLYRKPVSQEGMAPYVAISAASARESNSECWAGKMPVGSLSYAFNQALNRPRPAESYRGLFARIQSTMKQKVPGQTPQIEGDYDRRLFGGQVVEQKEYLTVKEVGDNRLELEINSGQLSGTFDSTKVVICQAGTADPKTAAVLATGTVVRSDLYSATIKLNKPVIGANPANYWVFVTEHSLGDVAVTIMLDSLKSPALRQQVQTELQLNRLVRFSGPVDLYARSDDEGRQVRFYHADGTQLDAAVSVSQLSGLSTQVQRYAQSQFLQRFNFNGNPSVQFDARLIPLRSDAKTSADTASSSARWLVGSLLGFVAEKTPAEANKKDRAALLFSNKGAVTLYYNVIDIMPNGSVGVIFPDPNDPNDQPENYRVNPGETKLAFPYIRFAPPYGKETFKIFATTEPVDLRQVVGRPRGTSASRGSMKLLERLYDNTNSMTRLGMGTRGSSTGTFPDDANIATQNYEFLILQDRSSNSPNE